VKSTTNLSSGMSFNKPLNLIAFHKS